MIKKFQIFEALESDEKYLSKLIGMRVKLIDRNNALYHKDGRCVGSTCMIPGVCEIIEKAIKVNDKILIAFHGDDYFNCYYDLDKFILSKRIFTSEDPYGEEDWDD